MRHIALLSLLPAAVSSLPAQSNTVPGLDGKLAVVDNLTYYGKRGSGANTEVGMAMLNTMCNPGTVPIPWYAAMQPDHPKFGFLVARVSPGGDRIEQISDWSYCKHAFLSINANGACGTCQNPGTGMLLGVHCADTYSAGNNASRYWLGPPEEIDPWLGTWNPVGSYFDRGDPDVGPPQNNDGQRSPAYSGSDPVYHRVTVREADLLVPGASYFYGIQLIHQGEAVANRWDNNATRGFNPQQSGNGWSFPNNSVGQVYGSILQHWPGASVDVGQNGNDDGRFYVAVKTTPLGGGSYHYEYAVHNVDNSRGGASFRVPIDPAGTASNFTFGDIDQNLLNDWTAARVGNEIVWSAPAGNPLNWNTIYNFGFDCDVAPSFGIVNLDEARIGPGALSVAVNSEVPSGIPSARVTLIGDSSTCGSCQAMFYEQFSNNSFDLSGSSMTMTLVNGEYSVGSGTATWVPPAGTTLNLGDDDQTTITLPFPLSYPGGTTNTLVVCSNGFVSAAGGNGTPYNPSSGQFVGFGTCWSGLWHDLNPSAGGAVRYESTPTSARISFDQVPYYGSSMAATFQFQFESNGDIHVIWQNVPAGGNDFLVGWTPGGSQADPGGVDLSVELANGIALCAAPFGGLHLGASARPILGTTISLDTTGIPNGSSFGVSLKALQRYLPPLDLTAYGMPGCQGHPLNGVSLMFFPTGGNFSENFAVPNDPSLTGAEVTAQTFTYSPPLTPIGIVASNGVVLTLGPQ